MNKKHIKTFAVAGGALILSSLAATALNLEGRLIEAFPSQAGNASLIVAVGVGAFAVTVGLAAAKGF